MIGIDLVFLAIGSITAVALVGFAAKAYDILRNDWKGMRILPAKKRTQLK